MFGSICCGGFAASPTLVGRIWIDKISGAIFLATNERLTSLKVAPAAFRTALHCRYFAFGLDTCTPLGSAAAVLHALHVSSAFSVFPVRVWIVTLPLERHQIRPQVAVVLASRTADS